MPHKVILNAWQTKVGLPNGLVYDNASSSTSAVAVVLTDEQFSKLASDVFTKNVLATDGNSRPLLLDGGPYGVSSAVGVAVSAPSAKTSGTAVATTPPTQTSPYGYTTSAQAAAIVTQLNDVQVDVASLYTALNALITSLTNGGVI